MIVLVHHRRRPVDVCALRRSPDNLGIYLDRHGAGLRTLVGWRIVGPYVYVILLLGPGRHRYRPRRRRRWT